MMETIVDIYEFSGTNTNDAYTKTQTAVKAWIFPATNESIALYEGMPQGQEFEFRIVSDDITGLKPQSKMIVVNSQISGFATSDKFITVTATKRVHLMGKNYLTGLCYKAE